MLDALKLIFPAVMALVGYLWKRDQDALTKQCDQLTAKYDALLTRVHDFELLSAREYVRKTDYNRDYVTLSGRVDGTIRHAHRREPEREHED